MAKANGTASLTSKKSAFILADEISGNLLHVNPLFGLMCQQLEEFGAELDPCESQAVTALYSLIDSASRYVADATKLCEDAQQRSRECSEPAGNGRLLIGNVALAMDDLAESQNLTDEARQMVSALGVITDNNPEVFPKLEVICAVLEKSISLNADSSEELQEFLDSTEGCVMTKNDDNKIDVANAADSDPTGLRMDPDRSARFTSITSRMARAIYSLEAASKLMEGLDFNAGEVNPAATVQAFCKLLSEDIDRMYQMLGNAEAAESDASKGGA
jgi:hypothetical protein